MPDLRREAQEFSYQELVGLGFLAVLTRLDRMETELMADFTQITQDVTAEGGAIDSAVALLKALHDELIAAGTDQTALTNLAANIEAHTARLADAVAANPDPATAPAAPPADAPPADAPPADAPPADAPPADAPPADAAPPA